MPPPTSSPASRRAARALAAYALAAAALSACASAGRLAAPTERFRAATGATREAVLAYLAEANRVQRAGRFARAEADARVPVTDSLYLLPVFSEADVAARAQALDLVGAYAARLATLSGAKRGEPLAAASKELGAQLTVLGTAAGGAASAPARYAGPLSALAGAVGDLWAERSRDRALRTLVPRAAPSVDLVLVLLASDLELAARERRSGARTRWDVLKTDYRVRQLSDPPAERARRLAALRAAADAYAADAAPPPTAALAAMRAAHAALVRAAASGRGASADVLGAVELFATRAEQARTLASAFRRAATASPAAP